MNLRSNLKSIPKETGGLPLNFTDIVNRDLHSWWFHGNILGSPATLLAVRTLPGHRFCLKGSAAATIERWFADGYKGWLRVRVIGLQPVKEEE